MQPRCRHAAFAVSQLLRPQGARAHPAGKCAFLGTEGASLCASSTVIVQLFVFLRSGWIPGECRVYEHRPYVCRTQGLPLRLLEEGTERRDICELNGHVDVARAGPEQCWTLGPAEARLRTLQFAYAASPRRIPLRRLFAQIATTAPPKPL